MKTIVGLSILAVLCCCSKVSVKKTASTAPSSPSRSISSVDSELSGDSGRAKMRSNVDDEWSRIENARSGSY